jgi:predicted GNAT superfamily acetyltransferase
LASDDGIVIRDCASLEDLRECVAVQRVVWGFSDEDLIPVRFFVVARKIEGQVIGAFAPSGKLVGFCLAVPALRGAGVYLHSHMLAVLPEFRDRGLGRRLKLEQRQRALAQGIRWIEWTFDPLEGKNAHFNLERLGAVARRYVPNQYGTTASPLHRGLPTDRLIAEWWLESPRAVACAEGRSKPPEEIRRRITIPLDIAGKHDREEESLGQIQRDVRRQFQEAFGEGLAAVGFEFSSHTGNYLLGPWARTD